MERLISTPAASPSPTPSPARARIRLPGGCALLPSRRLPSAGGGVAAAWPRARLQLRPGAVALASPTRHEVVPAATEEAPAAAGLPWKLLGSLLPKS
nr:unnamed protein product [Digitaria exilis]